MTASPYARRIAARPGYEADLKKRNLTNLYNTMPDWLRRAHETVDAAVAAAYGWTDYTPAMPDQEIKRRILALNALRAAAVSVSEATVVDQASPDDEVSAESTA